MPEEEEEEEGATVVRTREMTERERKRKNFVSYFQWRAVELGRTSEEDPAITENFQRTIHIRFRSWSIEAPNLP